MDAVEDLGDANDLLEPEIVAGASCERRCEGDARPPFRASGSAASSSRALPRSLTPATIAARILAARAGGR
jgi:hypothetical protein